MNVNWLKYRKNLRGRDPLGIQAINIHLYSVLVPGITNVTDRLRYYSFFPWILKLYKDENIKLDFVPFLRRAEFLFGVITYFHHIGESGHMVGTMVMGHVASDLNKNQRIVLSKYTDIGESPQRYFKNKLGGFGQYYLGVLNAMQILSRKGTLEFTLYPRGIALANAFNMGNSKEQFVQCILKDQVTTKDLEKLKEDICACNLKRNSAEYKLLAEYLRDSDNPYLKESTFRRRDSLALMFIMLKQIGKSAGYWELLNFLYYGISENKKDLKLPKSLSATASLWRYYMIHEFFSMALLAIFIGVQHLLDKNALSRSNMGSAVWKSFVLGCDTDGLQESLVFCLGKLKKDPKFSEFLVYLDSLYKPDAVWGTNSFSEISISNFLSGKQSPPDVLFVGGFVLLSLVLRAIKDLEQEPLGVNFHALFNQYPVNLRRLREDYNNKWKDKRVSEVAGEVLIDYVLNQHIEVAIRKLYTEGLATFRILREDGLFRHSEIEYDYVGNTSPRLREGMQMMADLKIVDENKDGFSITDESIGSKYLGELISGS